MKIIYLLFIVVVAVCFQACQKQVSWLVDPLTGEVLGDTTLNPNEPAGLLTKVVATTGTQTLETSFTYDSLHHLLSEHFLGNQDGLPVNTFKKYYRDTAGRIEKIATLSSQATDTVFTNVYYDDYDTKYFLNTTVNSTVQGMLTRDSSVYTYDGNGYVGLIKTFRKSAGGYKLFIKNELAYSGANLLSSKVFTDSNGVFILSSTCNFSYDNRVNPLCLKFEAVLTGKAEYASKNNPVSIQLQNNATPALNYLLTQKFIYGGSKKPLSATGLKAPVGSVTQYTYIYQ